MQKASSGIRLASDTAVYCRLADAYINGALSLIGLNLLSQTRFAFLKFGRERLSEVRGLVEGANFDFRVARHRVRAAAHPVDCLNLWSERRRRAMRPCRYTHARKPR